MIKALCLATLLLYLLSSSIVASETSDPIKIQELPEYIVISTEINNRPLLRRFLRVEGKKKSKHERPLTTLEKYLHHKEESGVRYHTDLLNVMSNIGFDFVQAIKEDEESTFTQYIFRKKERFRE